MSNILNHFLLSQIIFLGHLITIKKHINTTYLQNKSYKKFLKNYYFYLKLFGEISIWKNLKIFKNQTIKKTFLKKGMFLKLYTKNY